MSYETQLTRQDTSALLAVSEQPDGAKHRTPCGQRKRQHESGALPEGRQVLRVRSDLKDQKGIPAQPVLKVLKVQSEPSARRGQKAIPVFRAPQESKAQLVLKVRRVIPVQPVQKARQVQPELPGRRAQKGTPAQPVRKARSVQQG